MLRIMNEEYVLFGFEGLFKLVKNRLIVLFSFVAMRLVIIIRIDVVVR